MPEDRGARLPWTRNHLQEVFTPCIVFPEPAVAGYGCGTRRATRRRLSGAPVALPGTNTVDSSDIKNGQVKNEDIGKNAVTGK